MSRKIAALCILLSLFVCAAGALADAVLDVFPVKHVDQSGTSTSTRFGSVQLGGPAIDRDTTEWVYVGDGIINANQNTTSSNTYITLTWYNANGLHSRTTGVPDVDSIIYTVQGSNSSTGAVFQENYAEAAITGFPTLPANVVRKVAAGTIVGSSAAVPGGARVNGWKYIRIIYRPSLADTLRSGTRLEIGYQRQVPSGLLPQSAN